MKKIYSSCAAAVFISAALFAQPHKKEKLFSPAHRSGSFGSLATPPYTFSYSTGTYSNLANPVSLNGGLTWDDPTFMIPIGFNFILWDDTISTIYLNDLGGMLIPDFTGIQPIIYYSGDMTDRASDTVNWSGMPGSLSPISYELTGNPGTQILKVEWRNAGFYGDINDDNISTDSMNMQMWLYEGSNDIEVRFGPSYISQPALAYWGDPGPLIGVGLFDLNNSTLDMLCIQGNPSAPTDTIIDINGWVTLAGDPPDGIIYKFTRSVVGGTQNTDAHEASIRPNPVREHALVQLKSNVRIYKVEIADMSGKRMLNTGYTELDEGKIKVDCSTLASGAYILTIETAAGNIYAKLLRQ